MGMAMTCRKVFIQAPGLGKNFSQPVLIETSKKGKAIRFPEGDVRSMGRAAAGVRGIKLNDDDEVVGASLIEEPKISSLLVVMENGLGKMTPVDEYRFQGRGGTGPRPKPETGVTEIHNGAVIEGDGWRLEAKEVIHHQPFLESLGFRITCGGKVFTYTSDVKLNGKQGPVRSLYPLAQDADLLVHYLNGFDFEQPGQGVLTRQQVAATLARDARVKTLVTTHHGPAIDRDGVRERVIADIAEIYKGRLIWGQDLMTFEL